MTAREEADAPRSRSEAWRADAAVNVARAWARRERRALVVMAGLGMVVILNTVLQIGLNNWQGAFYDALEKRDVPAFLQQLLRFLSLAGMLLVLVVSQTWLVERLKIALRRVVTDDLLDLWLVPKRAYLLAFAGEAGANPDQRIQDDARRIAELTADLGTSLLQAILLLLTFVGVLWGLSRQVGFPVGGEVLYVPGSMVWCAVAFSAFGSGLAWLIGRPLVRSNAERYEREAELRLALVRVEESAEGITLYGGEADERRTLARHFEAVTDAMGRLARQVANLTWATSGYGWLALVVPVLAAAPGYFSGTLTLGGLMMVVGAFNQVQSSLRWLVDNAPRLADWMATLERILALRAALATPVGTEGEQGHIVIEETEAPRLVLEDLRLTLAGGSAGLEGPPVEVGPGEHVLIVGDPKAGRSMVFLALAGLWTLGSGTIRMPSRSRCLFLPERPYLPVGPLSAALAYPREPNEFAALDFTEALETVGLGHLAARLDEEGRWSRMLSLDEQQAVAFARAMLHRPEWLFLDDAMSALDEDRIRQLHAALAQQLPRTAVIGTGRRPTGMLFFERVVRLRRLS
ncbi:ABC transporter ATP-binding protein/permease [Prosthecodimorpha staleyi]|uniref:ABC transporter ATP-binding protein/permease n=1 Tax=Prosthecodimorpha staleyi TaxID=2840188 RepID=A0A947D1M3_9HYPH|nr:ABC transporter ATP-binding protein/permease [Prosthecodimorpha staleyi]MBT9289006.1 ABC transporter ATP-binding protein/permease [Prosthecodimorpha staleyi]